MWGSKSIASESIICTRDPKIGIDGVFQTSPEIKKVTAVREKTGSRRRRDAVEKKMQKFVISDNRRSKTGYIELLWR